MQKRKFDILLVAMVLILCSSIHSFAQQPTSTEKRALISEFRKLTGADTVNGDINFSSDGVRDIFSSVLEQDKETTDTQKVELRKSIAEATARIDKVARDFLADKSQITELSEEVIYQIYEKAFTESELKELIAFYRTNRPEGSSIFTWLIESSAKEFRRSDPVEVKRSSPTEHTNGNRTIEAKDQRCEN